jgi:chromosome segregation ATPase
MSTPANATSGNFFARFQMSKYQGALLKSYRYLAVFLLTAILLCASGYGITMLTFVLNSSWVAPVILSKSDPHVAQLAAQVFTAKQNYDQMKGELDSAEQARNLLQTQRDWLTGIIGRYEHSLGDEKDANAVFNGQLQKLVAERKAINARAAQVVAANRQVSANIDQALKAGLMTNVSATQARAGLVTAESALADSKVAAATIDNQISQLTRGVASLGGGNSSPEAMQSLAQVSMLKQSLSETNLKLVQLNADVTVKAKEAAELETMLNGLKASPYYMAAYGDKDTRRFAFVPYDNEDAAHVGAPVYSCKAEIVLCFKVGRVKSITKDEEHAQHPLFSTQLRGVLVELDLDDNKAAKDQVLFVGHSPFYVL